MRQTVWNRDDTGPRTRHGEGVGGDCAHAAGQGDHSGLDRGHVWFEGRTGEPHRSKEDRALRSDPYTYVPIWTGFRVLGAVPEVFGRKVMG